MTARLTPEREAEIRVRRRHSTGPSSGWDCLLLLAELDAVREERDLLRRHADAMDAGITLVFDEYAPWRSVIDPRAAYRAEFPVTGGERTTPEEEKR